MSVKKKHVINLFAITNIDSIHGMYNCNRAFRRVRRDSVSSDVVDSATRVMAIQNVTNLLGHTFSSQFVFPVLGHDDPGAFKGQTIGYTELGNYWRQWLPTDAIQTFNKGQCCLTRRRVFTATTRGKYNNSNNNNNCAIRDTFRYIFNA